MENEIEEYTLREYQEIIDLKLNYKMRRRLGINAVKVATRINGDDNKKWKSEPGCRPKGARVWSIEILQEILDDNMVMQVRRTLENADNNGQ